MTTNQRKEPRRKPCHLADKPRQLDNGSLSLFGQGIRDKN